MPDSNMPDLSRLKFGIGQPVPRNEDPVLLQGRGRYTDDISLPGQLHAVMVRSPYAHGVIRGIDISAATEVPGVVAVFTGRDLEGHQHCATDEYRKRYGQTLSGSQCPQDSRSGALLVCLVLERLVHRPLVALGLAGSAVNGLTAVRLPGAGDGAAVLLTAFDSFDSRHGEVWDMRRGCRVASC